MGNSAKKKEAARIYNEMRVKRKVAQEAERIDRIENPDKYRSSKATLHHAMMWMAVATGFGANSC